MKPEGTHLLMRKVTLPSCTSGPAMVILWQNQPGLAPSLLCPTLSLPMCPSDTASIVNSLLWEGLGLTTCPDLEDFKLAQVWNTLFINCQQIDLLPLSQTCWLYSWLFSATCPLYLPSLQLYISTRQHLSQTLASFLLLQWHCNAPLRGGGTKS